MLKKIFLKSCVSVLALGAVLSAMPAYAGFEWVPPSASMPSAGTLGGGAYAASSLPVLSPPVATSGPEIISPVVISGTLRSDQAAPASSTPVAHERVDLVATSVGVSSSSKGDVVQGFASQVPLVLALRQILPAGRGFSLDQDVDMDVLVSYKGGKSWRETLRDMLASVGLVSHEQGSAVVISRAPAGGSVLATQAIKSSIGTLSVGAAPAPRVEVPVLDNGSGGWAAQRGDTLRKVLAGWCQRSGVELQWLAEYDYPVEASAHFNGSFEDALRSLLAGFEAAHPQPIAELHANSTAGQGVLVVQARGNSSN